MDQLVEALRLLAAPPEVQRQSLPDWIAFPEEIALVVDDAIQTIDTRRDPQIRHIVGQLDAWLHELSSSEAAGASNGREDDDLWRRGRDLATEALRVLGEDVGPAALSGFYVQSRLRTGTQR